MQSDHKGRLAFPDHLGSLETLRSFCERLASVVRSKERFLTSISNRELLIELRPGGYRIVPVYVLAKDPRDAAAMARMLDDARAAPAGIYEEWHEVETRKSPRFDERDPLRTGNVEQRLKALDQYVRWPSPERLVEVLLARLDAVRLGVVGRELRRKLDDAISRYLPDELRAAIEAVARLGEERVTRAVCEHLRALGFDA
jgi:hypothetical protein